MYTVINVVKFKTDIFSLSLVVFCCSCAFLLLYSVRNKLYVKGRSDASKSATAITDCCYPDLGLMG